MEFINALEEAILHAADQPWALLALYLFCTIDGFFPPLPSESLVIALSSLAANGDAVSIWLIIPVAAAGAMTGDLIAFTIGRRIPVHSLRLFRSGKGQATLNWAETQLERRGGVFILSARYIPVGRVAVNMTAGAVGFPLRRFIAYDAIAAVMWASYGVIIGTVAGAAFEGSPLLSIGVGIVGGLIIGVLLDRLLQRIGVAPTELDRPDSAPARPDAATKTAALESD